MSIQSDLLELKGIENELKHLRIQVKDLNKQKKFIITRITDYIKSKELPGVKYNGTVVLLEEKTTRAKKKPKERDRDAIKVLENHGVNDAEKLFTQIMEARKGEEVLEDKLKVAKYKN